ncbi:hypothetical protein M407DRAFT_7981 [Tulasnella calospora MUT 4182]|uniref:Uncharacterized protein n=1 Tax=Tulasnella calospora MUT 4182 TaxID=1051891 RepID=A0A0C3Q8M7_9AGAM|nr:hypothetical protein M407DRAFT_7981 [Tulasnella calospora MUT 4182]
MPKSKSSTQSSKDEVPLWSTLTRYSKTLNLSKSGIGILNPGDRIAILPAGLQHGKKWELMDLWYAVYLGGGQSSTGAKYARIAWFYSKIDIRRVLPRQSFPEIYLRYNVTSSDFV